MKANVDQRELDKFNAMANGWWDPDGDFRPLHDLNPLRLGFIAQHCPLADARAVDIGCGAGILSEAMAKEGAQVIGIDLAQAALEAAIVHASEAKLDISYRQISAEAFADEQTAAGNGQFDLVTCLEMLEHVPDPHSIIVASANLLRPGGKLVLSTINRTPAAFKQAIVGAEYLLGLLPKGTHVYRDFIRPSELDRACRDAGLLRLELRGLGYQPFARKAWLTDKVDVNYIACYQKPL